MAPKHHAAGVSKTFRTVIINAMKILLLLFGLLVRYIIGRRKFNRRNIAGIQGFKSYAIAVLTMTIEKLANIIAALCIILATILFLFK
jgi:hypothetical protein